MATDSITCVLDAYKKISRFNPRARLVIEKFYNKEFVTLSVETNSWPSRDLFSKRKSASTIHRNNQRAKKFQENKAYRKDPSPSNPRQNLTPDEKKAELPAKTPPPSGLPSSPRPRLSTPPFRLRNPIAEGKRKHSEDSNVSKLAVSPIPQLDGADKGQSNDKEDHSKCVEKSASGIVNIEHDKSNDNCSDTIMGYTKEEFKDFFSKAWKEIEENKIKKQEQDLSNSYNGDDDQDQLEDAKKWAISQKR